MNHPEFLAKAIYSVDSRIESLQEELAVCESDKKSLQRMMLASKKRRLSEAQER